MMKKNIIFLFAFCIFSPTFAAATVMSVEMRAAAVRQYTQGNKGYRTRLARKLANIALKEVDEHDIAGAKQFIRIAEEYARQARGK